MTYQEIVDNFKSICSQHEIIREFGYGAISDIKTNNTDFNPDSPFIAPNTEAITLYPYVYLVPQQSTRTSQAITYRFNMIVMDTVLPNGLEILNVSNQTDQKDPPYGQTLKVQSDCQQYIDDILAQLRLSRSSNSLQSPLNYPLMDAQLNVNLTPFKERFQDTVAGMTATLEMELPLALNDCITPIAANVLVDYAFVDNITVEPDPTGQTIATQLPTYDPQSLFQTCNYTAVFVPELTQYVIEVTGTARATESKPITQPPTVTPTNVVMTTCTPVAGLGRTLPTQVTGWPQGQVTTTEFAWSATYNITIPALAADEKAALLWSLRSADPADEAQMELINTDVKIYEL